VEQGTAGLLKEGHQLQAIAEGQHMIAAIEIEHGATVEGSGTRISAESLANVAGLQVRRTSFGAERCREGGARVGAEGMP